MSEVVLTEIIEDMDVDRDGEVSLEEYIADIINDEDEDSIKDSERDNFNNNLDHDKNGKLDRDEVDTIRRTILILRHEMHFKLKSIIRSGPG